MQLNIFRIPPAQYDSLRTKMTQAGLSSTHALRQEGWEGNFWFSHSPQPGDIPWVETFRDFIGKDPYQNRTYFGAITLQKDEACYAISFGKTHFYIRPYCDYDFGIEIAKRIADENDITLTSARRYQGKQRKDIRGYGDHARLRVPPGNSVDFLEARILPSDAPVYGTSGKFGTSCLLTPDIEPSQIGRFLSRIQDTLSSAAKFRLPRTLILTDEKEIAAYDEKLVDELLSPIGTSSLASSTFDLYGVDFVFSSSGTFTIKCGHHREMTLDRLTMKEVKQYIADSQITRDKVLNLRVTHHLEGGPEFTQRIKDCVDYICDKDRVVLRGGKWLKFNEDYLEALDSAIRKIEVETTEADLLQTSLREPAFNQSLVARGYSLADKDFSIFKTSQKTPTEAWDLQRDDTVYAVKFGTPQKLNYVVDQASSVLELISNAANVNEVPTFRRYCLWLGYRAKKTPRSLAESGSIILKQKIEAWARQCEQVGYIPVLKLTRKINSAYDLGPEGSVFAGQLTEARGDN